MIGGWRSFPPIQNRQPPPPKPSHIWDGVTVDQLASMEKSTKSTQDLLKAMGEDVPGEQPSAAKNYQETREASGNQARKP